MTDEELDKMIIKLAEEYANENEYDFLDYNEYDDITDYESLKHAFIDGFKAGLKYKEEGKWNPHYITMTVSAY